MGFSFYQYLAACSETFQYLLENIRKYRTSGEFYRAGSTILSPEAIQEIKDSRGRIPNAANVMASKYHIASRRVYDLWNNCARMQQISDNTYQQKITSTDDPLITHNDEEKTKKSSEERLKTKSRRKKNATSSTSSIATQPVNSNTTPQLAVVPQEQYILKERPLIRGQSPSITPDKIREVEIEKLHKYVLSEGFRD
ncbi:hypothetical protein C1646_514461 [Rhizophagus diaphanus]|nr:hypothetical protein C1646_514461 [Rhizophagus diaphanus] [Rhizophagus sp. MUCL 43196]